MKRITIFLDHCCIQKLISCSTYSSQCSDIGPTRTLFCPSSLENSNCIEPQHPTDVSDRTFFAATTFVSLACFIAGPSEHRLNLQHFR